MKEITDIQELHVVILDIMKAIRDFCDAHGIRYFLCGGTLLGAIREKGFIPWDDDADIGMLRPDLNRFCAEFHSDRYKIVSPETDPRCNTLFPKVVDTWTIAEEPRNPSLTQGAFVDICPFDGAPSTTFYPPRQLRAWRIALTHLHRNEVVPANLRQRISLWLSAPLRLFPNRFITRFMTNLVAKYSPETSPFIGCIVMGYGPCEILPREIFENYTNIRFENEFFAVPSGWHTYLCALYGEDYMTPPPPDRRVSHHRVRVWWKQTSPENPVNVS